MPRKSKIAVPDIIHRLDEIVELRVLEVIQDGEGKRSNVYLIDCRRRQPIQSTTVPANQSSICVLKTFPSNEFHERLFQREVAAYTELQRSTAAADPEGAWAVLSSYDAQPSSWPFCFGQLQLSDIVEPLQADGRWIRPSRYCYGATGRCSGYRDSYASAPSGAKQRRGLLLEYMPNFTPLTVDRLNDELAKELRRIISELHAHNMVHGDFVDHASWPRVGFGNIFLRKRKGSGAEEVFVMDFNRSRIVGTHPRDQAMAQEEEDQMHDLLGRALEQKMAVDEIPKEVRELLG
ncbi:hypothetical protein INS49_007635 [Diaporthe citri]|uniref:uncharacterized protein n=1 Tax=Diaporthe citri TaxID=83186 RepID=UPI001C8024C0|nr:uncharacterized protein INS49_007635 [Diaporthe citri]KAG6362543.1 hypothetical protein INS49_007635 [Diaporthe citri]